MEANKGNSFAHMVKDQHLLTMPELELECGGVLKDVPIAYKTWGRLNAEGNNAMLVCHALSGSADVSDWWGALLGPGRALDLTRFFIIGVNTLGSPYGTASPVTINPETGRRWGPEFPLTTFKDDSKVQKYVLDHLGVRQVAAVVGGSMGGMLAQELLLEYPDFFRVGILLATSAYHSAWGISWGEAQRQAIYADPKFLDGYYPPDDPPSAGLGAARMSALLTYRSRNSFDSKFGRQRPDPLQHKDADPADSASVDPSAESFSIHNHGNRQSLHPVSYRPKSAGNYFTAQSYLRYQAQKFYGRFDANCYVAITRKLDTHDVSRGHANSVEEALAHITQPVLVIGISSDGLFTFTEQEELARHIPHSKLHEIESPEGHDAFLLEFKLINTFILDFLKQQLPELMAGFKANEIGDAGDSVFGEADLTTW